MKPIKGEKKNPTMRLDLMKMLLVKVPVSDWTECLSRQAEGGPGADGPRGRRPSGTAQEHRAGCRHVGFCLHR